MPIEIRELVVRARVGGDQSDQRGSSAPASRPGAESDFDAIVQACVREVMRVLEDKRER